MVGCAAGNDWTVEQHAMRVYGRAGADPCNPPGPFALITMLGGEVAIHRGTEFERGDGRLVEYDDGWAIEVHPGLPIDMAAMALARGIVQWYLRAHDVSLHELECVDDLAACILLPAPAMTGAVQERRGPEHVSRTYKVPVGVAKSRLAYCGASWVASKRSGAFRRA